ncbi:MAG: hypothetical protein BGP19_05770 [Thiobacillus sp. 0-1251]|nr:MAG: hypothetical protein BGP19_05770 [Thiobacillus sp. 0-1251]
MVWLFVPSERGVDIRIPVNRQLEVVTKLAEFEQWVFPRHIGLFGWEFLQNCGIKMILLWCPFVIVVYANKIKAG